MSGRVQYLGKTSGLEIKYNVGNMLLENKWFSNFKPHTNHLRNWLQCRFWFWRSGTTSRFCISYKSSTWWQCCWFVEDDFGSKAIGQMTHRLILRSKTRNHEDSCIFSLRKVSLTLVVRRQILNCQDGCLDICYYSHISKWFVSYLRREIMWNLKIFY